MLPKELIAKVRKIEIKTRRIVDEITGGAYHSIFKGRGIEFDEVREYTPEDDVRDIDWNVTARMGTPYIKKYVEERELTVILAVDVSASGFYGSGDKSKSQFAAETAALLAFSAIRNNDKVGLLLFSDKIELFITPRSGKSHGLRLIRELLAAEPESRGTDINYALKDLLRGLSKKSVVFLMSDFIDDKDYSKMLKIANRRHDVIAVRVLDNAELKWKFPCDVEVEDSENGGTFFFPGASGTSRNAYEDSAAQMHRRTVEVCRQSKVDMIDVRCGEDIVKPLISFFRRRQSNIRGI